MAWWNRKAQQFSITAVWYPNMRDVIEYEFCRRRRLTDAEHARLAAEHTTGADWYVNEAIGKVDGPVVPLGQSLEFAFLWLEENAGMVRDRDSFVFSHYLWRDAKEISDRHAGK